MTIEPIKRNKIKQYHDLELVCSLTLFLELRLWLAFVVSFESVLTRISLRLWSFGLILLGLSFWLWSCLIRGRFRDGFFLASVLLSVFILICLIGDGFVLAFVLLWLVILVWLVTFLVFLLVFVLFLVLFYSLKFFFLLFTYSLFLFYLLNLFTLLTLFLDFMTILVFNFFGFYFKFLFLLIHLDIILFLIFRGLLSFDIWFAMSFVKLSEKFVELFLLCIS